MLHARKVWIDLKDLLELLDVEDDQEKFKYLWIAAVAICRTVGSTLDKVDKKTYPEHVKSIASQWSLIKKDEGSNQIFHDFIKFERDNMLKEYVDGKPWGPWQVFDNGKALGELYSGLYCPIQYGPYVGEDCRDVMREALQWWDGKLKEIEQLL